MSREIPFFELFAQLQLSPELRLKLLGAVIASACIHQDTLSMELAMIVKHPLEPSDLDELNSAIRNGYGLNEVRFRVTLKEEQLPSQWKAAAAPSAPSGGGPSGPVLMGNPIKVKPVEMKTLDLKMGNATVSGKVFSVECVETRRPGMWRLHVEMTDYTSSVAVHKNLTEKEAKGLDGKINPGMWLCVQGKMEPTWDGKDIQLNPYHINVIQHEERQDTAPVKRGAASPHKNEQYGRPDGHEGGHQGGHPLGPSRHCHHRPRRGPVLPGRLACRRGQDQDPLRRGGILHQQRG